MRQLTFAGFLKKYIASLSRDGGGFYKLAREASASNARLREPLLLYAVYTGRIDSLLKATRSAGLLEEYQRVLRIDSLKDAVERGDKSVPMEYRKVWNSYTTVRDAHKRDEHTKSLMRDKILRLQVTMQLTTYRIYKDLRLNPGNVNAWLKNNDGSKVGLDTARKILEYVVSCQHNLQS